MTDRVYYNGVKGGRVMRNALAKLNPRKVTVFTGRISKVQYQRMMVTDICVYDESGNNIIGTVGHCLLSKKHFKDIPQGSIVRFTGTVKLYTRHDGSKDYTIVVRKATIL